MRGRLTSGLGYKAVGHEYPQKSGTNGNLSHDTIYPHTECDLVPEDDVNVYSPDFLATIYGTLNGRPAQVTVEIDQTNPAWTYPGTKAMPYDTTPTIGAIMVQLPGDQWERRESFGPDQQDSWLTVNPDHRSGSIDAWFPADGASDRDPAVEHVYGTWRCA